MFQKSFSYQLSHSQMFAGSFVLLIIIGTFLFKLLPGLYIDQELSWLDALFTATSAICVTGLIVVDTATYFTFWGQLLILVLIQVGGLGMLTFTSLIILALGRRLSLSGESLYKSFAGDASRVDPYQLVYRIVSFTFIIESIGAALIFVFWYQEYPYMEALWLSVFHSVSAFCNAGFSVFSDSLIPSSSNSGVLLTCGFLILLGGIGFFTIEEIIRIFSLRKENRKKNTSLQSRIVLGTSVVLIVSGTFLFGILEWSGALESMNFFDKFVNAFFMSITCRTAGFNSVEYAQLSDASNFLTIILMMIGGSPGSAAGGIKTTTFFLIFLLAWSRIKGDQEPSFRARSIPAETINRAIGLLVVASLVVTSSVFLLCILESSSESGKTFLILFFEVVSAFNTVGLSIGTTADLSAPGKILLIFLMLLGRVGPLTFAAALFFKARTKNKFRYAYEDVVVG
jgi:trk system potassium uptake protein TrkH